MAIEGIIGRKVGMTQVYADDGRAIPATVIQAGPCVVVQRKSKAMRTAERKDKKGRISRRQVTDGYEAVQLGLIEDRTPKRVTKPMAGHFQKTGQGAAPVRVLREFRLEADADGEATKVGAKVLVDQFSANDEVTVIGTSKGRGFQGVVKRHGFGGGPKTHGQSDRWRAPGSIGAGTDPGHVWKGTRMAGRMGNRRVTVQNLEVVEVLPDRHLLLVRGSVPGAKNGLLMVRRAVKGQK